MAEKKTRVIGEPVTITNYQKICANWIAIRCNWRAKLKPNNRRFQISSKFTHTIAISRRANTRTRTPESVNRHR